MKRLTPGSLHMQHIQSVVKAVQELSLKQPTLTLPSWVYTIASECPFWKNYRSIYTNINVSSMPPYYRRAVIHVPWSWHYLSSTAYTITGCDPVSYPFHIGKKRALKCALENRDVLETMANYSEPDVCLQPMPEVLNLHRSSTLPCMEGGITLEI